MAVPHGFGVTSRTGGIQDYLGIVRVHGGDGCGFFARLMNQGLKSQNVSRSVIVGAAANDMAEMRESG